MTKRKNEDDAQDIAGSGIDSDSLTSGVTVEQSEPHPILAELQALVLEWQTHHKSQGLMTDELKVLLTKHAPDMVFNTP